MTKEAKSERFVRLAEARVNKIIKMVRLLGNLSWSSNYEYTTDQVAQIFKALQTELNTARRRFAAGQKRKKQTGRQLADGNHRYRCIQLVDGIRCTARSDRLV